MSASTVVVVGGIEIGVCGVSTGMGVESGGNAVGGITDTVDKMNVDSSSKV